MILTSIILTAAALYLLTYGGRTSIEETVVARDALTKHYVTPYYKIESISDDRGVPKPETPDTEHAPVLSLNNAYETVFTEVPNANANDVAWGVISPLTGGKDSDMPLDEQVQHLNNWVGEVEGTAQQDRAWQAYQWAHKFNADHAEKVKIDFGH